MKPLRLVVATLALLAVASCGTEETSQSSASTTCLSGGVVEETAGPHVDVSSTDRILGIDQYGSITRTLTHLGLADSIVGRTVSSTEPEIADTPLVTVGGHQLNVEAVLELAPDLIIADDTVKPDGALQQLKDTGINVAEVSLQRDTEHVGDDIRTIAHAVGHDDAGEELALSAESDIASARKKIAEERGEGSTPPRMAYVLARGDGVFMFLGTDSGTTGLIQALGGTDVANDAGITAAVPATAEAWSELNPEIIIMTTNALERIGGVEGLQTKPGVELTDAGSAGRVLSLPDGMALSFGPQTGEMIAAAAKTIYGC